MRGRGCPWSPHFPPIPACRCFLAFGPMLTCRHLQVSAPPSCTKSKGPSREPPSREHGKGRTRAPAGLPHLCFWTGSRRGSPTWSESLGAAVAICSGKGEKLGHTLGRPQTQPRDKARPRARPHWDERSTCSTFQSQFSGKKLRTGMSSSSIRSSSRRSSMAAGRTPWRSMMRRPS